MKHNTPLFEVTPFADDMGLTELLEEIAEAKADVAADRVYSHEEVLAQLAQ